MASFLDVSQPTLQRKGNADAAFYTGVMPDLERWPTVRLLSTAARLVEHAWNEKLSSLGLTHAGVIALDVLAAKGPMTQAMLAGMVRVQAQTIGKTLVRLESHGYVHRQTNPSDRRSHVVSITDAGDAVRESARDLEATAPMTVNVNPDTLRKELKTVVRELAAMNKAGRTILETALPVSRTNPEESADTMDSPIPIDPQRLHGSDGHGYPGTPGNRDGTRG